MLFSFFIQSISVCDQFKHADNPIAIVQTRSCVNISGLTPGEEQFHERRRTSERADGANQRPFWAKSAFLIYLLPVVTWEGYRIKCHTPSLFISMYQKQFSFFHPERFRLFAANLMAASLRR
jgi:hypothetical protein